MVLFFSNFSTHFQSNRVVWQSLLPLWIWFLWMIGRGDIKTFETSKATQRGNTWLRHQLEIFSALLALCAGNSLDSPHKGQWRGALMFSLICAWTKGWANNRDAGDLRRSRAHYDVIEMIYLNLSTSWTSSILTRIPKDGFSKLCIWLMTSLPSEFQPLEWNCSDSLPCSLYLSCSTGYTNCYIWYTNSEKLFHNSCFHQIFGIV